MSDPKSNLVIRVIPGIETMTVMELKQAIEMMAENHEAAVDRVLKDFTGRSKGALDAVASMVWHSAANIVRREFGREEK